MGPGTGAAPSLKVTVPPGSQFHDPPPEKTVEVATRASVKSLPAIGAKKKFKSKETMLELPPKKSTIDGRTKKIKATNDISIDKYVKAIVHTRSGQVRHGELPLRADGGRQACPSERLSKGIAGCEVNATPSGPKIPTA
jgi:hypothetical protein